MMELDSLCCPICMNPFSEETESRHAYTATCSHSFCQECLKSLQNEPCPICRERIVRIHAVRTRALEAAVQEFHGKANVVFSGESKSAAPTAAEVEKQLGNEAYSARQWETAVRHFTEAIKKDFVNHVLYSNRSAAFLQLNRSKEALEDAEKCLQLAPHWAKGYSRKAAALLQMGEVEMATVAINKGLQLQPTNAALIAMKEGLAKHSRGGGGGAQKQQQQQQPNRNSSNNNNNGQYPNFQPQYGAAGGAGVGNGAFGGRTGFGGLFDQFEQMFQNESFSNQQQQQQFGPRATFQGQPSQPSSPPPPPSYQQFQQQQRQQRQQQQQQQQPRGGGASGQKNNNDCSIQ